MKKEISVRIKGMHCGNCAKSIQRGLEELDGVESVEASFAEENAKISFDPEKVSLDDIEEELIEMGYELEGSDTSSGSALSDRIPAKLSGSIPAKKAGKTTLKQGLVYGLVPHIGCIGFIAASILGVTVAVEFFKPLLMNPWFFHILVLISIGFATISSAFYLKKNGVLSMAGIKRKKKYLSTMYGATVGINLVLFLAVFPLLANLDTGSFADAPTGVVGLAGSGGQGLADSMLRLQVDIPCPGHAPLISGELKTIEGVTGVRFDFPNFFDVAFDSGNASKQEILELEVFETYPANLVEESLAGGESGETSLLQGIKEVEEVSAQPAQAGSSCGGSCGGSGSGSSCGGGGSCGCGG